MTNQTDVYPTFHFVLTAPWAKTDDVTTWTNAILQGSICAQDYEHARSDIEAMADQDGWIVQSITEKRTEAA